MPKTVWVLMACHDDDYYGADTWVKGVYLSEARAREDADYYTEQIPEKDKGFLTYSVHPMDIRD